MSRSYKNACSRSYLVVAIVLLITCSGCSLLGLSTGSVAHNLTDQTKEVIERTPRLNSIAREGAKTVNPVHYLQPGDELLIEVIDNEAEIQLPADQRILADGSIDLGKYGRAVVASMTLELAESTIHDFIASIETESFAVNVRLIQGVHRYYVIGEVNSPGAFPLVGHETVLDAILEAGGLTGRASACDLILARPTDPCACRVALPVCYRAITQLGDTTTNYHLQPGDRIFVGKQTFTEELRSYCHGGETCERCCKKQVACRNPHTADHNSPAFVAPVQQIIPVTTPPMIQESNLDTGDSMGLPRPVNRLDAATGEPISPSRKRTRSPRAQKKDASGLDGELDFDSFMNKRAPAAGQR